MISTLAPPPSTVAPPAFREDFSLPIVFSKVLANPTTPYTPPFRFSWPKFNPASAALAMIEAPAPALIFMSVDNTPENSSVATLT